MAHDDTLLLLGTTGNPQAVITATAAGSARFAGKNRSFEARLRVGGDVTGTSPTLDMRIQESANGTSGWATIATFPQVIDEQVGYVATATPRYEVPGEDPLLLQFRTSKDYIRVDYTVGGSATPTFNGVSVELTVAKGYAGIRSGVA